jgi:hypothetical protein
LVHLNRTLFEKALTRAEVKDFNDLLARLVRTLENEWLHLDKSSG